jgi:hypothetical protein
MTISKFLVVYALLAQSQATEENFSHEPQNAFFLVIIDTSKGTKSLTYQLSKPLSLEM